MTSEFRIEDKVVATRQREVKDGPRWPVWGGRCGYVSGIVTEIGSNNDKPTLLVSWNNGEECEKYARRFKHYSWKHKIEKAVGSIETKIKGSKVLNKKLYKRIFIFLAIAASIDYFLLGSKGLNRLKGLLKETVSRVVNKILTLPLE